jgi:hypothetical protein
MDIEVPDAIHSSPSPTATKAYFREKIGNMGYYSRGARNFFCFNWNYISRCYSRIIQNVERTSFMLLPEGITDL